MRSADRMAVHLRPVTLRNWIVRPDAPALAVSGLSVGLLGFAHGGYFPEAWGWASIALCWCAICTVMLRESVDISIRVVWLGAGVAAALAWSAVSLFWTSDVTNGVQSVERDGLYLSLLIAAITVCERRARVYILGGVTAGIVIVSTYAVLTRLFPDRLGVFADPQGPGRLFVPLGYWNGEADCPPSASLSSPVGARISGLMHCVSLQPAQFLHYRLQCSSRTAEDPFWPSPAGLSFYSSSSPAESLFLRG